MIFETIIERTPIDKGWSGDRKFRVATVDGNTYLLRISPADREERKRREFAQMQLVAELGIPMCLPVEFGRCDEGVYALQSWIDGQDAEAQIPLLPTEEQYRYGLQAGRILAKIHTLPAPEGIPDWSVRFNSKIDRKQEMYRTCPLQYENGACFADFIEKNRHLLQNRPQTYQHGDYHIGNMMVDRNGVLTILDFDRDDYGDPWEEFNRIVWCAQAAPAFASGMVDGYFDGAPPEEFWRLLALYICTNTLSSLPWAIPFGETQIEIMRNQAVEILDWYDGLSKYTPYWYAPIEKGRSL